MPPILPPRGMTVSDSRRQKMDTEDSKIPARRHAPNGVERLDWVSKTAGLPTDRLDFLPQSIPQLPQFSTLYPCG